MTHLNVSLTELVGHFVSTFLHVHVYHVHIHVLWNSRTVKDVKLITIHNKKRTYKYDSYNDIHHLIFSVNVLKIILKMDKVKFQKDR